MLKTSFVRDEIIRLAAYQLDRATAPIKLNQNESPWDFPAELKREVMRRVERRGWNRYPDIDSRRLRTAIAAAYALDPETILTGNGSNEMLLSTIATVIGPGRRVVIPTPAFQLYEKLATIMGGEIDRVPFDPTTGRLPLDAILKRIDKSPSPPVVVICSPNNPTGGVLPAGGLNAILQTGAFVIFDRAYGDFASDKLPPIHERLVTLSTLSKAWGLAALRLGFAVATPEMCREIAKARLPYNLNIFSEEAAIVALENAARYRDVVQRIAAERRRVFLALHEIDGVTPFPSAANFICFAVAGDPISMFALLLDRGVLVRNFSSFLRVTIGTPIENDAFLNAIRR
jgi:histidinol-phosphate aminotransferase